MFTRRRFLSLLGIGAAGLPLATFARKAPAPHAQPLPGMVEVEVAAYVKGRPAWGRVTVAEQLWREHPDVAVKLAADHMVKGFNLLK